ncbi:MAG TPA: aspartate/glutamate racemase family protein [Jatrophihabitans sp.]|nr:aspartate/glutamate racemase family protein [Jatrophihabitans sp.]
MRIGVFDSGIGGRSVANAVEAALPDADVLFRHDTAEHFPYATKSPDEIYEFVLPIFDELVAAGCEAIVIACNTVSTTLVGRLREVFGIPLVALEPMVKPAAELSTSGVVAICATPTTLASARYAWLKETYGNGCAFLEPDCSDWSYLIEHNRMNEERIREGIEPALAAGADVIVLGCTHYHWIEEEIDQIAAGRARVLQPESAVVAQLKRVLQLS